MKYISGLDGLRCFSILFVLLEHLGFKNYLYNFLDVNIADKISMAISGKTGVAIFFVISGYLITSILLREKQATKKIDFKNFFIRRILRLFPAFFVFMMVLICFFILTGRHSQNIFQAWFISFIYLYNFVPFGSLRVSEIGHTWSLAIEEQFYLVWPLIINFIKLQTVKLGLIVLFFIFIVLKIGYDTLPISSIYESYRLTIPGAFPVILGCFVAFVSDRDIKKTSSYTLLLGFILFFNAFWMPVNAILLPHLNFFLQPVGVALIIDYIVRHKASKFVMFFEVPIFIWMGRLSYSIYLWQGLFLKNGPGSSYWIQQFPQNLALTFLCATVSFYFIEKKFISLKNKYRVVSVNHD